MYIMYMRVCLFEIENQKHRTKITLIIHSRARHTGMITDKG